MKLPRDLRGAELVEMGEGGMVLSLGQPSGAQSFTEIKIAARLNRRSHTLAL